MESFGQYLVREREFRQISRDEIATATRIPLQTLAALEEDQADELPAPTFVKGFIQAYAKYLGLDPAGTVLRFEEYLAAHEVALPEPALHLESFSPPPSPSRVRTGFLIAALLTMAAAGVAILARFL